MDEQNIKPQPITTLLVFLNITEDILHACEKQLEPGSFSRGALSSLSAKNSLEKLYKANLKKAEKMSTQCNIWRREESLNKEQLKWISEAENNLASTKDKIYKILGIIAYLKS